jgi:hypothetical protein
MKITLVNPDWSKFHDIFNCPAAEALKFQFNTPFVFTDAGVGCHACIVKHDVMFTFKVIDFTFECSDFIIELIETKALTKEYKYLWKRQLVTN